MLKIQRTANGEIVFTLAGRLEADNLSDLSTLIAAEPSGRLLVLDLKDVVLVDRNIVRFLIERSVIVCDTDEFRIDESWLSIAPPSAKDSLVLSAHWPATSEPSSKMRCGREAGCHRRSVAGVTTNPDQCEGGYDAQRVHAGDRRLVARGRRQRRTRIVHYCSQSGKACGANSLCPS
jgi:hypothetical protein